MEKLLKTAKAFILMFLVITVPISFVQVSKEASVGVKVGDWAKYSVVADWNSDDPNATIPTNWQNWKNTEGENVTVKKISGTNITVLVTTDFINGAKKDNLYWGDIATNRGSDEFGFQIIDAGLDQGDIVRQSMISINYTESKVFAGQNRIVNYASATLQMEGLTIYEYRWDKETGILCASIITDTFTNSTTGHRTLTQLHKALIETSLWKAPITNGSPQPWTQWGVPLVVATIGLVAFILVITRPKPKGKRRKRT